MRILLTHRFFWPDTSPYGVILRSLGEELAGAGHDVRVFTSKPSYGKGAPNAPRMQQLGDIEVRRIWVPSEHRRNPLIRVVNVVIYCVSLFFHVLFSRAHVVTACTFPPVLAAWSASLAAQLTGARFIYHMQDIHPEISSFSGGFLGRRLPSRILRWLDNQTLRRADKIVTLSGDMAETLLARGLGELPIHIINNPSLDAGPARAQPPERLRKPSGTCRVIFAGNLGRFQDLPLLAEGVARCFDKHPELELMFLGDGVALPELNRKWGEHPQVRFAPFMPFAQAREIIADADIGLVSLSPNIYRVAYPSKIATYLDLGLKVLALVEPESQIATELVSARVGAVPTARTAEAVADALESVLEMEKPSSDSRANMEHGTDWISLIKKLELNE